MKSEVPTNTVKTQGKADWLTIALNAVARCRATVFGDFCLDAYWELAAEGSPVSVETSLPVRQVLRQAYSPGGAGNIAVNLMALGAAEVRAIGLVGDDLFGSELRRLLAGHGIELAGLRNAQSPWQTPVYAKPHVNGKEANRLDFGGDQHLEDEPVNSILEALDEAAGESDVVILNQQLLNSIVTPHLMDKINALIRRYADVTFVADTRDYACEFRGAILKINEREAIQALGRKYPAGPLPSTEVSVLATALAKRCNGPVVLTRGEYGLVLAHGEQLVEIPGIQQLGKTDPVGAGDTVVAALAAAIGGGCSLESAARFANLAASISAGKPRTGGASRAELQAVGPFPDYIYKPELATAPRRAHYLPGTEIEVVRSRPSESIRHVIFDHDGTLSTLRQGWEAVMGPMMMKAVLGPQLSTATDEVYRRIEEDVKTFIDRTTGIQTLAQMTGLIALVHEYGFVPTSEILDEHGYKAIYNEALLRMVQARIRKIEQGELEPRDFEIKGARALLEALHATGLTLYLASGTDEADVRAEAAVMGYAHLFTGGIYGAVGDVKVEAKRLVIERILGQVGATGSEIMVVGDGPVELRAGRKRGALCLGIASNEICRYGLDETKRTRVIRAGADYVVADFSQLAHLKALLGI